MRRRWADVRRVTTGRWDYVIYSRVHGVVCCSGTVGTYPTWRLAFNAAFKHILATGGAR